MTTPAPTGCSLLTWGPASSHPDQPCPAPAVVVVDLPDPYGSRPFCGPHAADFAGYPSTPVDPPAQPVEQPVAARAWFAPPAG